MAKHNEKRDILIATAAVLFWHQGYAVTSLANIATNSGIPLGNIYYYFKSKADLARGVADIFVAETEDMLREITEADQNPRVRLKLLIEKLAHSLKSRVDHGCPIALGIRDFRNESPEAANRAAEAFSLLIGFIGRELGRSGIRPSSAGHSAQCGNRMARRYHARPWFEGPDCSGGEFPANRAIADRGAGSFLMAITPLASMQ